MNSFLRMSIPQMLLFLSVILHSASCLSADVRSLTLVYTGDALGQIEPVKY